MIFIFFFVLQAKLFIIVQIFQLVLLHNQVQFRNFLSFSFDLFFQAANPFFMLYNISFQPINLLNQLRLRSFQFLFSLFMQRLLYSFLTVYSQNNCFILLTFLLHLLMMSSYQLLYPLLILFSQFLRLFLTLLNKLPFYLLFLYP